VLALIYYSEDCLSLASSAAIIKIRSKDDNLEPERQQILSAGAKGGTPTRLSPHKTYVQATITPKS